MSNRDEGDEEKFVDGSVLLTENGHLCLITKKYPDGRADFTIFFVKAILGKGNPPPRSFHWSMPPLQWKLLIP